MGWDGYLVALDGADRSSAARAFLASCQHLARNEQGDQWWYENPRTGVYFSIGGSRDFGQDEQELMEAVGVKAMPLFSLNINYARPAFFGAEASAVIGALAHAASLALVDLHGANGEMELHPVVGADSVLGTWRRNNLQACDSMRAEAPRPPWPAQSAMEWWRYQFHLDELQAKLGESVFAPTLALIDEGAGAPPLTAVLWSECIPMVFPRADRLLIRREIRRGLLRRKSFEMGFVDRDAVLRMLEGSLERLDGPWGQARVLSPEKARAFEPRFMSLDAAPAPEGFAFASSDGFFDS